MQLDTYSQEKQHHFIFNFKTENIPPPHEEKKKSGGPTALLFLGWKQQELKTIMGLHNPEHPISFLAKYVSL